MAKKKKSNIWIVILLIWIFLSLRNNEVKKEGTFNSFISARDIYLGSGTFDQFITSANDWFTDEQLPGNLMLSENFEDKTWEAGSWEAATGESHQAWGYAGNRRYFDFVKKNSVSGTFTYLDTTIDGAYEGKSLKASVYLPYPTANGTQILYTGMISADNDVRNIMVKSLPYANLYINVVQLDNAHIGIVPGGPGNEQEIVIKQPTNGWQQFSISFGGIMYAPAGGTTGRFLIFVDKIDNSLPASATFYIDNYKIYITQPKERNTYWYNLAQAFASQPQGADTEISTTLTSSGPSNSIYIGAVPTEPEHFSVIVQNSISNVIPTITNLVGRNTGQVWDSNNIEIRHSANKINRGYVKFGVLTHDINLIGSAATQDTTILMPINYPNSISDKIWFSWITPNLPPDIYDGTATIGVQNIPVSVEIYDFVLDAPAIKFASYNEKRVDTKQARIDWVKKALFSAVQVKSCTGNVGEFEDNKPSCLQEMQTLYNNGLNHEIIPMFDLLSWEHYRYLFGGGGWVKYDVSYSEPSAVAKFNWINSEFAARGWNGQKYIFHDDTENDCGKWDVCAPFHQLGDDYGFKTIRAAGPRGLEYIYPNVKYMQCLVDVPAWTQFDQSRNKYTDYVDIWTISTQDYIRNQLGRINTMTGSYANPFTDKLNYASTRKDVWEVYLTGGDYYWPYSIDRCPESNPFSTSADFMCLYIPTSTGLLETEKSEGFVRGAWDMRYMATLERLSAGNQQATDFVEIINTRTGWRDFKYQMVDWIKTLGG